ncbi:hypothetical protein BB560_004282 [Smittium megazygosporum]|uniref:Ribosomal protein L7/L12 C-terminal domain-containing protein n=1 Tax=Smittium megazygosporum TaxID=133381 RepID=A0A2T9Z9R6_9FUNG|nr:hypothetical protein BB560_004282 [Smittium megazygosporum]
MTCLVRSRVCLKNQAQLSRALFHTRSILKNEANPIPAPDSATGDVCPPKIKSIVDEIGKLTLIETSQLVKELKTRFNITETIQVAAAVQTQAPQEAAAQEKAAEKSEYTIKLEKFDKDQKAKTIKEIKSILPELNLIAAKNLVESAPKVIKKDVPKEEAEKIKKALEALGATVVLE